MGINKEEIEKAMLNDLFWFQYSRNKVEHAIVSRNEAADKLQNLIIWLWGIYTAGAAVGLALSKTSYSWPVIILIFLPSPILIIAYWFTVWAQIPIPISFKPNIPYTIREEYIREIFIKEQRLNWALRISFVAAVLVSVVLGAASYIKQESPPDFQACLHKKAGNNTVTILGILPADSNVLVKITPVKSSDNKVPIKIKSAKSSITSPQAEEYCFKIPESGKFEPPPIKLTTANDKYDVTVEWQDKEDGLTHSLKRTIGPQDKDN